MPAKTPRPPVPFLAILLAPFTWLWGRPDLFDTYRYRNRGPRIAPRHCTACEARLRCAELSICSGASYLGWTTFCAT